MRTWERKARDDLRSILQASLLAATPQVLFREKLRIEGHGLWIDGRPADLRAAVTRVAAVGKAARGMASQAFWLDAEERLLVTPDGLPVDGWETIRGGHPVPTAASAAAGERLLELADATGPDDLLVLFVSGGASALVEAPSIPLADLRSATELLLASGAPIAEVNAVRKHLSRLKGGRLAARCRGRLLVLALSDVRGNAPSDIASGPASPDPTTYRNAAETLQSRGLWVAVPASVRQAIEAGLSGETPETPKPGDRLFDRVDFRILGSNATALDAAALEAARRGYTVAIHRDALAGEARRMGERLAALAREAVDAAAADGKPRVLLFGGETTVTVRGDGKGGRNQETILALVEGIAGRPVVAASIGTDGVDGPTDAAGAIADGFTLARAQSIGLNVEEHLAENDAYAYFAPLRDLVETGPTGTNVMDVAFILVGPTEDS